MLAAYKRNVMTACACKKKHSARMLAKTIQCPLYNFIRGLFMVGLKVGERGVWLISGRLISGIKPVSD